MDEVAEKEVYHLDHNSQNMDILYRQEQTHGEQHRMRIETMHFS